MEVWEDIEDTLHEHGIKRDIDVFQLNLARKGLTGVPDLSRFHFLRQLWLNNNQIRELSCRSLNCCLTELYLHDNHIKSISGSLSHLTCLQLLCLHNNQIRGLEETMQELRKMQQLHTVNPGYRHLVIHCLPSVQVLDRREVKPEERSRSFQMHRTERHRVLQSVAFGRRSEPPTRTEGDTAAGSRVLTTHCPLRRHITETTAFPRSIMQFSMLDWKAVPTRRQKQLGDLEPPPAPRILTVTLR
ncbi:leucine-rich repeat-containing protein 72 [Centroberyx gerrardi]